MARSPRIYLDHAAATPLDPAVFEAMRPYFSAKFYNPSATYAPAREVRQALAQARGRVAHWLGSRPSEIVFTAGGTEANNLALFGVASQHDKAAFVSTEIEHDSILQPLAYLKQHGWQSNLVAPTEDGLIDPNAMAAAVTDRTVLVSVGYANNEIGTVQPIRKIAQALDRIRYDRRQRGIKTPLYFHTDACQAANYLDLHVTRLGVDLLTLNGGKIYGPKQSGALFVKAGVVLAPLILGGGQERTRRSGTENVAAIIGLAAALDLAQTMRHEEGLRLRKLQEELIAGFQRIPDAVINGSLKYRLPNNVHVTIPGQDNERLLILLEQAGILAAAGSACSASNEEPSHVLRAIGLSDAAARASLRFTMGRETTADAVKIAIKTLAKLC
jgi:cysteine desulfurase